jgi:putative spermidine/putrescine transport system substrate-binding protein
MTPRRSTDTPIRPAWPRTALVVVAVALAALVAGCGGSEPAPEAPRPTVDAPPGPAPLKRLGPGEGRVMLLAPPGHAERGATEPGVDWVTRFEQRTGCQVAVRTLGPDDDAVALLRSGRYDAAAVPGDVAVPLISGGVVAQLNPRLLPNRRDVFEGLRDSEFTSAEGRTYGVPEGRVADVLTWRQDKIPGSLSRSDAVYEPAQVQPYRGRVTAEAGPPAIADAAVWLMANRKELGITNPYELDAKQFRAAVDLVARQQDALGAAWTTADEARSAFAQGDVVVGMVPQGVAHELKTRRPSLHVEFTLPREGSTGVAETWMLAAKAKHPTCAYRWMNHVLSPQADAQAAAFLGQAPATRRACELDAAEDLCDAFKAGDEDFWSRVWLRSAPRRDCGDDRGAVCKDARDWAQAWTEAGA